MYSRTHTGWIVMSRSVSPAKPRTAASAPPSRTAGSTERVLDGAVGQGVDPAGHDLADAVRHVVAPRDHDIGAEVAYELLVGRTRHRRSP